MDGRQPHARRHPSFDAGDDQFFTYPSGAPADYGGYQHRRGQHSSASGYNRPPRTPDHGDYDYSQYAAARLAISPPFGAEYDNGVRYDNVHHSQQPSLSQSVVSYSSNVPSPPPHRDLPPPPVPPPHRSQHSFRQHQSQFPISDTISERPLEEGASLQHSSSQSSTQYPQSRALPPTPDDAEEEDDCEFDSVLENIAWVPSPPARNGVGRGVEDPEAVLYRDDRGMSIGSIDAISRHGSSGRDSLARHSSTNSPGYDRRSVGSMMRAENEPAAPFTISGYAPDDDVDQTPVDYSGLDDSFLDAYDDMSILSPPPLGHRGSQGNNAINPNAPSTRLDYDGSYATAQESPSEPQSPTAGGFMDSFDDLDSFVRPLPIPWILL
ncbi:hypothetical protein KEM56_003667 [Ascosphaera pollenicola]|nr:hypothetical protein KEM56_003667 [Ascosphaera pollenicola]